MKTRRLKSLTALVLAALMLLGCVAQAASTDIVSKAAIRALTMNRRTLSMDLGSTYTLKVTVSPSNGANWQGITWDNPRKDVLSLEENPADPRKATIRVIATEYPANPKVLITAMSPNGKKAYCTVTIKPVPVTAVTVSPARKTVYLTSPRPAPFRLTASVSPSVAGELGVTWESQYPSVATVDPNTGYITVIGEGTTRIYATSKDGSGKRGYSTLNVLPVRVKTFALSVDSPYMNVGDNKTITPKILPANASWKTIKWESDDKSVVQVDADGNVTALKSGVAKVSAETDIGKYVKKASITIYVRSANPEKVAITALGDVILGGDPRTYSGVEVARSTLSRYKQFLSANNGDFSFPFQYIRNIFADLGSVPNLGFMNLECAITSKGSGNYRTTRSFVLKGEPKYISGVAGLIDAVSVANNHAGDLGGYSNTLANIKQYGGGAKAVGERLNADYMVGDKKVTFIAVVSKTVSASTLAKRIQLAKKNGAALVVVSVHWTNMEQYKAPVTGFMKSYARAAIRAGADLFLGHHRHLVSGIEKYRGKYIVYDLGNSIVGATAKPIYAFQIVMEMHESFNEVGSAGRDVMIYPLWSTSSEQPKNNSDWQPVPVEVGSDVSNKVVELITKYSPKGEDGTKFDATPFMTNYPGR